MSKKYKVLFIVYDQLRADCVVGALASHIKLPNIQALRNDAVTFTNHFSVANPCGPSRASLLTGLYAMNHRSVRNGAPLNGNATNLAIEVRKSGYEPLLFGYTDTSQDPRNLHPNDPALTSEEMVLPGFNEVVEMRSALSLPWRAHLKSKGYKLPDYADFYNPVPSVAGAKARIDDPAFYSAEDSDTAFLTDALLNNLSVRTDQSWFVHIGYIRPHPPLVAPEPYNKMYDPDDLPLPARLPTFGDEAAVHPFLKAALAKPNVDSIVRGIEGQLDPTDDNIIQTLRAIYFGLASEVDAHLGRIIQFLKDTEQYDDTIIVLTSDHGETLGEHHMWGKQNVYEGSFRIPLIIRDPGNPECYGTT
ncbi:MAG: sulfatase-like hydrolase/transferase, partial [Paracoccaceae bacterium]